MKQTVPGSVGQTCLGMDAHTPSQTQPPAVVPKQTG